MTPSPSSPKGFQWGENRFFYRRTLVLAGGALVSLLLTFWSHYHLLEVEQQQHQQLSVPPHVRHHSLQRSVQSHTNSTHKTLHHHTNHTSTNVIHIVYTRFMQHQANLTNLGLARMELFQTFFLRSLSKQSTDNFLVVIRADPDLHPSVRDPLIQLLEEEADFHYLLIGTNENVPNSHQYTDLLRRLNTTRDGLPVPIETLWSGNGTYAQDYVVRSHHSHHHHSHHHHTTIPLVIESRLDSDDGLHREFLEYLQRQAVDVLGDYHHHSHSWRISCAGKYMEWQMVAPWEEHPLDNDDQEERTTHDDSTNMGLGSLVGLQVNECISAGLSIAYYPSFSSSEGVGVGERVGVPTLRNHEKIASTTRRCRSLTSGAIKHHTNCMDFVELSPSVVRARTPTSAGMLNVLLWDWNSTTPTTTINVTDETIRHRHHQSTIETNTMYEIYKAAAMKQKQYQPDLWEMANRVFGLSPDQVRHVKRYLTDHMASIARENLQGQCSAGHSCKNGTRIILQRISGIAAGR